MIYSRGILGSCRWKRFFNPMRRIEDIGVGFREDTTVNMISFLDSSTAASRSGSFVCKRASAFCLYNE